MDFSLWWAVLAVLAVCAGMVLLLRRIVRNAREEESGAVPSLPACRGVHPFWVDHDGEILGVISATGPFVFLDSYQKKVFYLWPVSRLRQTASPLSRAEWEALVGRETTDNKQTTAQAWGQIVLDADLPAGDQQAALLQLNRPWKKK